MRNKRSLPFIGLLASFLASGWSHSVCATDVVTVGQLANATANLVLAQANADRAKAADPEGHGGSGQGPSVVTAPGTVLATPRQSSAVSNAPTVVATGRVGGRLYATVRMRDGTVTNVPVPTYLDGGYSVRIDGTGQVVITNQFGRLVSATGSNPPDMIIDPRTGQPISAGPPSMVSVPVPQAPVVTPTPPTPPTVPAGVRHP